MKEKYSKSRARRQAFVRRTISPDRPDLDAPEADRAAWWRQHVLRMTRDEMADLTGFSVAQIKRLEDGSERSPKAWRRYRLVCGAVAAGVQFNWLEAHVALRQEAVRV